MNSRLEQLQLWLEEVLLDFPSAIIPLTNDASFRRYSRICLDEKTLIAMDSPPEKENNLAFVGISSILQRLNIDVPKVLAVNYEQGFLLLTDLGDDLFANLANQTTLSTQIGGTTGSPYIVDNLYGQAFEILLKFHNYQPNTNFKLPIFDHNFIQGELDYFTTWFVKGYLQINLTQSQGEMLAEIFTLLKQNAQEQPQIFIHRDFHSRNLLIMENNTLGVLDFQDAMVGPLTYDLVSLLKDCYLDWPANQIDSWVLEFLMQLNLATNQNYTSQQFLPWFHLMGLQRHLKVLGIFARLHLRDNKPAYLKNLPRVFNYVEQTAAKFPELAKFYNFLLDIIKPSFVRIHYPINSTMTN